MKPSAPTGEISVSAFGVYDYSGALDAFYTTRLKDAPIESQGATVSRSCDETQKSFLAIELQLDGAPTDPVAARGFKISYSAGSEDMRYGVVFCPGDSKQRGECEAPWVEAES